MMTVHREIHLVYQDYKSDKEYHLVMETDEYDRYKVTAKFGPRNGNLTHVDKTKGTVSYSEALTLFDKTEKEKRSKGYEHIETNRDRLIKRLKKLSGMYALTNFQWDKLTIAVETILEEVS